MCVCRCVCACVCVYHTMGSVEHSALEVGLAELECHVFPGLPAQASCWRAVGLEWVTAERVRTLPVG